MDYSAELRLAESPAERPTLRQISGRSGAGWLYLLVATPLLLAFGLGLAIGFAFDRLPQGVIYGSFVAGVVLIGGIGLCLEFRAACYRPGAVLGTAPDGRPATVIARSRAYLPLTVLGLIVLAATPLASGVVAILDDETAALAVFMLPLGLWLASYLIPVVRGQVHAGGLYLTPEGITHVRFGSWWRLPWEDVLGPVAGQPVAVAPNTGRRPQRGRTCRWGWKGDPKGPVEIGAIDTRHMAEDPGVIFTVIGLCVLHPEIREELGTPESLTWPPFQMRHSRRFTFRRTGISGGSATTGDTGTSSLGKSGRS